MDWPACRREMEEDILRETATLRNLGDPDVDRQRSKARRRMSTWLLELGQVDDTDALEDLIGIELLFLDYEARVSQDRPTRLASITAAMEQLDAALYNLGLLREPGNYKKFVDRLFSPAKHRAAGLPLDIARLSFRSHAKRLDNAIKEVRGPDEELRLLSDRLQSANNFARLYIALQRLTLAA